MPGPYRDYLPPGERARRPEPTPPTPPPRPGHGTVWVLPPRDPSDDAGWSGSWQDDDRVRDVEGTRGQVRAWVEAQPAARAVVFLPRLDRHVPLDDAAWEQARG